MKSTFVILCKIVVGPVRSKLLAATSDKTSTIELENGRIAPTAELVVHGDYTHFFSQI